MPPRRAKNFDRMDCSTSPSLTKQKSPANTSYIQPETPATMVNTNLVGTSQRELRKRPPPPPVSDAQQNNGRRTSLRAKAKVQSKPQDHQVAESISKFDNDVKEENHQQSTKVVSLIQSSSRRIGQGRPPIAPSQVSQSPSLEKFSGKHLVSAKILQSEENMFQKQTPGNRNTVTSVMENTETPVTAVMKSNLAAVRSSTRNARVPMTEVVKNGSIRPVRSSARIKKADLNDEEAVVVSEPKKSTVVASKRNSASEKLQPTTAKRAKKDCEGSSDKDVLPTDEESLIVSEPKKSTVVASERNSASEKLQPTTAKRAKKDCEGGSDKDVHPTGEEALIVSEPKKSTVVASKRNSASEKLQATTAKRAKKDCKGGSDKDVLPTPIIPSGTKRGRSLSTSKSLEILSVQSDNPSLKDEGVSQPIRKRGRRCNSTKSVESDNIEENVDIQNQIVMNSIENIKDLEERAEETVETATQPKRRRPAKTLTKMTEETKHLKVMMESTSLRDLPLGESPPQSLIDLSINEYKHGINASDSKDDTQICATLDTEVSLTAQKRGKKNVNKKAASRTSTQTNKKANSSASLVDTVTVPLASLGETEPLTQSSDVIIIPAAMKKVNKKPSSRLTTRASRKNADSSVSLADTILSTNPLEVSNTSAALPSTLDTLLLHTIGDDEKSSHPNSDEIAQSPIELLKQKMPKKMTITEGRNTKQRTSSKAAQKAPPLPSVAEDELDEQQTSLAMDELKNTQKADGILNSKTQISIAMDELENVDEKPNSNVQTGGKKGVTKKRSLQEDVLKTKRLKKSTEMPCARTPNSTHTITKERANVKSSDSATKHSGDWDANEITNTGGCKLRNDILKSQGQGKAPRNRMLEFDALPVRFGLGISGL